VSGEPIRIFDSQGDEYRRAFQVFLDHTDQKRNARRWLRGLLDRLPSRNVFVDAGAGSGEVTAWLAGSFRRTIAVEPNPLFCEQLRQRLPVAVVLNQPIQTATPLEPGDLVLCSHTFYYVDRSQWLASLERLASWLSPDGTVVLVLQNRDTDCMAMLERFGGRRYDLAGLGEAFRRKHGSRYDVRLDLDEAHVETRNLDAAYRIAEFMLNLAPLAHPPLRADVEAYVRTRFATGDGRYRFSNHQDFLQIRPRR
jgi:SAM-dependent methyltransferase